MIIASDNHVLVSVGIPVRNGGDILRLALRSVMNQTYKNLQIVISNNASDDQTEAICLEVVASDSRIEYFKQDKVIPAIDNFRFVFEQSRGQYFMWAAHDDLRSENYIETLLAGFKKHPHASIIASEDRFFDDSAFIFDENKTICGVDINLCRLTRKLPTSAKANVSEVKYIDFSTASFFERHALQAKNSCLDIYGLINSSYLTDYKWYDTGMGPDVYILHWLLCRGDFIRVKGCFFYYYVGRYLTKDSATYNRSTFEGKYLIRHSWVCAQSVVDAYHSQSKGIQRLFLLIRLFVIIFLSRHGGVINLIFKGFIYRNLPLSLKSAWRNLKGIFSNGKPRVI